MFAGLKPGLAGLILALSYPALPAGAEDSGIPEQSADGGAIPPDANSSSASGEDPTKADAGKTRRDESLLSLAPDVYRLIIRYPKFYGDPNTNHATVDGPLSKRQYLAGSLDGFRDKAAHNGLIIDAGLTQVVQSVTSNKGDGPKFVGSADFWLGLDTARAGLWPRGLIYAHVEGDWGDIVEWTGALLPVNADSIMPGLPDSYSLSELIYLHRLPAGFVLIGGKLSWTEYMDLNLFADNERTQFLYEGLAGNPILGTLVPYTSIGAAAVKILPVPVVLAAAAAANSGNALEVGTAEFGFNRMTYAFLVDYLPVIDGKPGLYSMVIGYSTGPTLAFNIDERYLIGEILDLVPPAEAANNYGLALSFSQYVWIDRDAGRSDGQPVGLGPFFRFGITPPGRNVIDRFYSFGIGGTGAFGRNDDNWGIGWSATHFSDDFRRDAAKLGSDVGSFEHGAEVFYNIAVTPAIHASVHIQYINSAAPHRDDTILAALRLQLDF